MLGKLAPEVISSNIFLYPPTRNRSGPPHSNASNETHCIPKLFQIKNSTKAQAWQPFFLIYVQYLSKTLYNMKRYV